MIDNLKYLFVLFPFIGIACVGFSVAYRRRLKAKAAVCCGRVEGSVVGNNEQVNYGRGNIVVYLPVVEYVVGKSRLKVIGSSGYWPRIEEGTPLTVMYNPGNPSEAFVEKGYYLGANIALLIGGAFILLGSFFAYEFCS